MCLLLVILCCVHCVDCRLSWVHCVDCWLICVVVMRWLLMIMSIVRTIVDRFLFYVVVPATIVEYLVRWFISLCCSCAPVFDILFYRIITSIVSEYRLTHFQLFVVWPFRLALDCIDLCREGTKSSVHSKTSLGQTLLPQPQQLFCFAIGSEPGFQSAGVLGERTTFFLLGWSHFSPIKLF